MLLSHDSFEMAELNVLKTLFHPNANIPIPVPTSAATSQLMYNRPNQNQLPYPIQSQPYPPQSLVGNTASDSSKQHPTVPNYELQNVNNLKNQNGQALSYQQGQQHSSILGQELINVQNQSNMTNSANKNSNVNSTSSVVGTTANNCKLEASINQNMTNSKPNMTNYTTQPQQPTQNGINAQQNNNFQARSQGQNDMQNKELRLPPPVQVKQEATGNYTGTATISAQGFDPNSGNIKDF